MPLCFSATCRLFFTHWLILWAGLGLLALTLGYHVLSERRDSEATGREHLVNHSRIAASFLTRQLNATDAALNSVIGDSVGWSNTVNGWFEASRFLKRRVTLVPGVHSFLVLDPSGNVLASNQDALIGKNFAHRDYFQKTRDAVDPAQRGGAEQLVVAQDAGQGGVVLRR